MSAKGSLLPVGPKFWNLRSSFYLAFGLIDIGTHLSLIQLNSGKFLVLSTVGLPAPVKADIDHLTENGALIEAVIATHAYHTIHFEAFHKAYPQAKYYGTSRHIKNFPKVQWAGDIAAPENLKLWEEDGVEIRIPAGTPLVGVPESNHFSGLFVYHKPSRTIHVDDTLMFFNKVGMILGAVGVKPGRFDLHLKIEVALADSVNSPLEFKAWFQQLLDDWDFDNVVVGHNGYKIGGAKAEVQAMFDKKNERQYFEGLVEKNKKHAK